MKKAIQIVCALVWVLTANIACSQNSTSSLVMTYSEQTRDSLVNQLKNYDYEPNYQVHIDTKNSYEILVNDLLISYRYSHITGKIGSFINWGILKSGKQKFQIKLYPRYIDKREQLKTLINDDFLDITISSFTWRKDNNGVENEKEVLKYTLPKKDKNGNTIDYTQKSELIIDLEFEAQVPYELKGWTDGVVFNKNDSVKLKQKLASIYQERINNFKNKEFDDMLAQSVYRDFEVGQSIYDTKDSLLKSLQEYSKLKEDDLSFLPLENYELYFYGNGRLICLRRIDERYKGGGAIIRRYKDERGKFRASKLEFYFYQPKGSDKLVLIR